MLVVGPFVRVRSLCTVSEWRVPVAGGVKRAVRSRVEGMQKEPNAADNRSAYEAKAGEMPGVHMGRRNRQGKPTAHH